MPTKDGKIIPELPICATCHRPIRGKVRIFREKYYGPVCFDRIQSESLVTQATGDVVTQEEFPTNAT